MIRERIKSAQSAVAVAALMLCALAASAPAQVPMGTAFTYQGQLTDGGIPIEHAVDLRYSLWDAATGGIQLGTPATTLNTAYSGGLLQTQLDFGDQFNGDARYLQLELADPAGGTFQALSPRIELQPVPYALHAETVTQVDDADADPNNETITATALVGTTLHITEAGVDQITDLSPLISGFGSMATQSATNVSISGGTVNGTSVGGATPAAGTFTSVAAATGTFTTGTFGAATTVIGDSITMAPGPVPGSLGNTLYNLGGELYWEGSPLSATTEPIVGTNVLGDLTVDGSLGVGTDTVPGMAFNFDTIILRENNTRILFDDTSTSASFPRNDWRLTANDSANGGDSYFGVEDVTLGSMPFRIEAGAPSYSLVVNDDGSVGVGTANPTGPFQVTIPGTASEDQSQMIGTAAVVAIPALTSSTTVWQSFTTDQSGELTEVRVQMGSFPVPLYLTLALYEGEGTSGALLGGGAVTEADVSGQILTFSFPIPLPLTAGSQYSIALTNSLAFASDIEIWMANTNPYAGGMASEGATYDWMFSTFMREVATPLTVSATGTVGIGTTSATHPLHVVGSLSGDGISSHVALIDNASTASSADGLAIRIGRTDNPGSDNNFITFYNGNNTSFGAIEGNGASVQYAAAGADLAEYLPLVDPVEPLQAGDVVGVLGGSISRRTEGAERVLVVSTAPAFAGNDPGQGKRDAWRKVAFLGQVPVRVQGVVRQGDLLLASGRGDGLAEAVAGDALRPDQSHLIVGRAWESSEEEGVKLINAQVGLSDNASIALALQAEIRQQEETIEALRVQNQSLEERLLRLEAMITGSPRQDPAGASASGPR